MKTTLLGNIALIDPVCVDQTASVSLMVDLESRKLIPDIARPTFRETRRPKNLSAEQFSYYTKALPPSAIQDEHRVVDVLECAWNRIFGYPRYLWRERDAATDPASCNQPFFEMIPDLTPGTVFTDSDHVLRSRETGARLLTGLSLVEDQDIKTNVMANATRGLYVAAYEQHTEKDIDDLLQIIHQSTDASECANALEVLAEIGTIEVYKRLCDYIASKKSDFLEVLFMVAEHIDERDDFSFDQIDPFIKATMVSRFLVNETISKPEIKAYFNTLVTGGHSYNLDFSVWVRSFSELPSIPPDGDTLRFWLDKAIDEKKWHHIDVIYRDYDPFEFELGDPHAHVDAFISFFKKYVRVCDHVPVSIFNHFSYLARNEGLFDLGLATLILELIEDNPNAILFCHGNKNSGFIKSPNMIVLSYLSRMYLTREKPYFKSDRVVKACQKAFILLSDDLNPTEQEVKLYLNEQKSSPEIDQLINRWGVK